LKPKVLFIKKVEMNCCGTKIKSLRSTLNDCGTKLMGLRKTMSDECKTKHPKVNAKQNEDAAKNAANHVLKGA
jgi:hypothetical protein